MPRAHPKLVVGFSLALVLAGGLAITFLRLWPRPVSLVIAGASMLFLTAAMILLGVGAGGEHVLRMQKTIFLASGFYGLMFILLALKNHQTSPVFSEAALIDLAMVCSGAAAAFFIPRSLEARNRRRA